MSKTKAKHQAQDSIMQRLADTLLIARENGEDEKIIFEMYTQILRIGKLFGYSSWPGIGHIS